MLSSTDSILSVSASQSTVFWFCVTVPTAVLKVSPLSVSTSHCTVCFFCVIVSTALIYSLATVCQYLTIHRLFFCVTMSKAFFYGLSTVCQYITKYRLFVLCQYVLCCLLQSLHCLSVPHNVPSVRPISLSPLLSSIDSPMSVSMPYCTVC